MAKVFIIDAIEGNSNIGVPVFSKFGQMQNYNYIVLSPTKVSKFKDKTIDPTLDQENEKFRIQPATVTGANGANGSSSKSKIDMSDKEKSNGGATCVSMST